MANTKRTGITVALLILATTMVAVKSHAQQSTQNVVPSELDLRLVDPITIDPTLERDVFSDDVYDSYDSQYTEMESELVPIDGSEMFYDSQWTDEPIATDVLPIEDHAIHQSAPRTTHHNRPCDQCAGISQAQASLGSRYWVQARYLNWQLTGSDLPALITASPNGTDRSDAGVLGLSTTSVLLGNEPIGDNSRSGVRLEVGGWIDDEARLGWHAAFFNVEDDTEQFQFSSNASTILARPFLSLERGSVGQNADIFGLPGEVDGHANVQSIIALEGAELMLRQQLLHQSNFRFGAVAGYQYFNLDDSLHIRDFKRITGNGSGLAIGTTITGSDQFDAENLFHGAALGFVSSQRNRCWSLDTAVQLAVGNNQTKMNIRGQTVSTVPAAGGGSDTATASGGLLALPSNSGSYEQNELAVVPQLNVDLGYRVTTALTLHAGYRFLYWSKVLRSGDQIDPAIDLSQLDPGSQSSSANPRFDFRYTDFVAHGLDFGIDFRF